MVPVYIFGAGKRRVKGFKEETKKGGMRSRRMFRSTRSPNPTATFVAISSNINSGSPRPKLNEWRPTSCMQHCPLNPPPSHLSTISLSPPNPPANSPFSIHDNTEQVPPNKLSLTKSIAPTTNATNRQLPPHNQRQRPQRHKINLCESR
jgi:hypothetical protein